MISDEEGTMPSLGRLLEEPVSRKDILGRLFSIFRKAPRGERVRRRI
jgi:hypothetical protein